MASSPVTPDLWVHAHCFEEYVTVNTATECLKMGKANVYISDVRIRISCESSTFRVIKLWLCPMPPGQISFVHSPLALCTCESTLSRHSFPELICKSRRQAGKYFQVAAFVVLVYDHGTLFARLFVFSVFICCQLWRSQTKSVGMISRSAITRSYGSVVCRLNEFGDENSLGHPYCSL